MAEQKFPGQNGETYIGKVRKISKVGKVIVAETTDDISAFDVVLPIKIPKKGVILNLLAQQALKATEDIIPNCLLAVPNPRVSIWRNLKPFMIEMVVRRINTGSFNRDYTATGKANPWGYIIPAGLKQFEQFPELLITPTNKAKKGTHDEAITREQIIEQGLATAEEYDYLAEMAVLIFVRGEQLAAKRGLILADTKYEFGKDEKTGIIYLIDEVHTPDSSRFYYSENYDSIVQRGESPRELSKEFLRKWLIEHGYQGKEGDVMPEFTDEFIELISNRYLELYSRMTGEEFEDELLQTETAHATDAERVYTTTLAALVKIRPEIEGPTVSIVMGSSSDLPHMEPAIIILTQAGVPFEVGVVSAHRTPGDVQKYAQGAREKGTKVIIAAAGGAAHLPGMVAASTTLPVIGVPIKSANSMIGLDSLLSIVQMPAGVPVGTMAIDGSMNGALFALQILGATDERVANFLKGFKAGLIGKVGQMRDSITAKYFFNLT